MTDTTPMTDALVTLGKIALPTAETRKLAGAYQIHTHKALKYLADGQLAYASDAFQNAKNAATWLRADLLNKHGMLEAGAVLARAAGRAGTLAKECAGQAPAWQFRNNPRPPGAKVPRSMW